MHYTLIKSAYEFDKNSNQFIDFTAIISAIFAEIDIVFRGHWFITSIMIFAHSYPDLDIIGVSLFYR